jgi:hypothetical protein
MRLAASRHVYDALAQQFGAAGVSADGSPAALIWELHALLRSKGYSEQAAGKVAESVLAGREPLPHLSRRFAALHGHTP